MFSSLDPGLEDWGGGEKMSSQSHGRDEGALGGLVPSACHKPSIKLCLNRTARDPIKIQVSGIGTLSCIVSGFVQGY